jgi:AraC-like DNA-binding protein
MAKMQRSAATPGPAALLDKARLMLATSPVAAAAQADEALALAVRQGDTRLAGEAALLAGQAHLHCGQYASAEQRLAQAFPAFEATGQRKRIGTAYVAQSRLFFAQDRISEAHAAAMRALGYSGLPAAERARLFAMVAICFCDRADLASGRRVMQEHALPEAERCGDPATFVGLHSQGVGLMHVYALWSMGIPHADTVGLERPPLEQPQVYIDTAKRYAAACDPFLAQCSPADRAFATAHRGLIVSLEQGWRAARPLFDEAQSIAANQPRTGLIVLGISGLAARVAEEWAEARARLEKARAQPAAQVAYFQRLVAFDLAQVYAGLRQPESALEALNAFTHLQTSKGKLPTGWIAAGGAVGAIRGPIDSSESQVLRARAPSPAVLKRAVDFIDRNLTRRLMLAEVAREAGVSTRTLQTLHKAHHGMSASVFIRERRMQRAKALLAEGPASIGNVAEAIGYSNAANFSRDFRKRFGRAPSMILRSPD